MNDAVPVFALTATLLLAAVAVPLPVGGVPDARLTVSDVTLSPETPVTGAPVTADVTVRLSAGSSLAVTSANWYSSTRTATGSAVRRTSGRSRRAAASRYR